MTRDDENATWKIPEWQAHWKAMGAVWAHITPDDAKALPHYRAALEAAIKDGTARKVEKVA